MPHTPGPEVSLRPPSGRAQERRLTRVQSSPRFVDGHFRNSRPTGVMRNPMSLGMVADFAFGGGTRKPPAPLPLFAGTRARLSAPPQTGLRVTWLSHSTVLIEIDGVRLLTDPVWGNRASPVGFAGPKRFHPMPLALGDLGHIDAIVLSHDHYDHLCADTWRKLAAGAAPGWTGPVVTALGVGKHLAALGVAEERIIELDWGEGTRVGTVDVVATPAQHFSGRSVADRNETLWMGVAMRGPQHRVFFSGDTGPTDEHADIAASLGPFDVVLLEIGAWHEAWGDIHLGPEAALAQFAKMRARTLLPVHWSTFDLGLHPWAEPGEVLYTLAEKTGADVWFPLLGQPLELGDRAMNPWWREVPRRA